MRVDGMSGSTSQMRVTLPLEKVKNARPDASPSNRRSSLPVSAKQHRRSGIGQLAVRPVAGV